MANPSALVAEESAEVRTDGLKLFINHCLANDGGEADRALLEVLGRHLLQQPGLCLYGAGWVCRRLLEQVPDLSADALCIIEDDPEGLGQPLHGLSVLPAEELPAAARTVFLCSTRYLCVTDMTRTLELLRPDIEVVTLGVIEELDPDVIPERAYRRPKKSIYPTKIPPIEFESDQDVILLEFPPRYFNSFPGGIGYVHEALKRMDVRHQTMDLNAILYHRYHAQRILDGIEESEIRSPDGEVMPKDPWWAQSVGEWHNQQVVDYFAPEIRTIVNRLVEAAPKILGVSLNGSSRLFARAVVNGVRSALPDTVILVGGFECVYHTVGPLVFPEFDYMVILEAEGTLSGLIEQLLAGELPTDLPGIVSRFDSPDRVFKPAPLVANLDQLGFPTYDYMRIKLYRHQYNGTVSSVPIVLNRGCKWSLCNFCAERFPWRTRSPEHVTDEIEWFVQQGFSEFGLSVSDAIGDSVTLRNLGRCIAERGLKVKLHTQLRIDKRSDAEFFEVLAAAGVEYLAFGVDGWTDHLLRLQRKGYNMKLVERNFSDCHAAGIKIFTNLLVGSPGETDQDIDESIENIIALAPYIDCFHSVYTLLLVPGSLYYADPEKHNIHFRGDREQIYAENPSEVPLDLWYSEEPYIDQSIRVERLYRICTEIQKAGVEVRYNAKEVVDKIMTDGTDFKGA